MAKRLIKKDIDIDAFISSPANRALSTAQIFAEEFGKKNKKIISEPSLYEASPDTYFEVIESIDDDIKTVAIFSHNPGITTFANSLTQTTVEDMPTCAIYAVKVDANKWKHFREAKKQFWFFDYPKSDA